MRPFWPRHSPHFLDCRRAVRALSGPAVIGLSGGPDSLALVAAAAAQKVQARAVVVDHGLQPGSGDVAERAADQARAWGVEAEVVTVTVPGQGSEAAARKARYAALLSFGVDVWVAHTADDQAETFLLGALRGNPAGMGLRGGIDSRVVRPFLALRRADTVGACAELGVEPWHDPMNSDPAYRRVALRQTVIPQLSQLIGGDCVPALAAAADRIAADRELIDSLTDTSPSEDCDLLAGLPRALRMRRIAAWLLEKGVPCQGAQLGAVDRLVADWHGQGPVAVKGGWVRRVAGHLVVDKR